MALVLTRKAGDSIMIETPGVPTVTVTVTSVSSGRVKLSIVADQATRILRGELGSQPLESFDDASSRSS